MSMHFSEYFVLSLLDSMGWPRKKHFLGKKGVSGAILRHAVIEMVEASTALGAGRPLIACQLITKMFRERDWRDQTGDELFASMLPRINDTVVSHPELSPWEAIAYREVEFYATDFVPWDVLMKAEISNYWLMHSAAGLIYGLANSSHVAQLLQSEAAEYRQKAPEWIEAGLNITEEPPWADIDSYCEMIERTLLAYQAEHGKLPISPPQLLNAEVVRARLK